MSPRFFLSVLASLSLGAPAFADPVQAPKGVVELFTSQGCSSCPPADDVFRKLVERGDLITLAYHVDYWNYMGWADTLSSKENTERQYGYARSMGRANVYTPQVVVNGRNHLAGANLGGIEERLAADTGSGQGLGVPVAAKMTGDQLEIKVGPGQGRANIVAVYFEREKTVDVEKGENSGRKIAYVHSVSDVETVGMWDGKEMSLTLPATVMQKPDLEGCAILLQSANDKGDPTAILGAAVVMAGKPI